MIKVNASSLRVFMPLIRLW